jgi:hypothetical protein
MITEPSEFQLDRKVVNQAVAAYARNQHPVEQRQLMANWGELVAALESGDNVVSLRTASV